MSWTTHQLKKDGINATYCTAAENTLGYLKSTDKTWLTRETWKRIEERKTIKSKRIQERFQKEYSSKDNEIKSSARQDKRA